MEKKRKKPAETRFVDVLNPQGVGYRIVSRNAQRSGNDGTDETVIGIRLARDWPISGRGLAVLTLLTRGGRNRQLKLEMENRHLDRLGLSFFHNGEAVIPYSVNLLVRRLKTFST